MDISPAKRSYFTCANVWWKLLFHSTFFTFILNEKLNLCPFHIFLCESPEILVQTDCLSIFLYCICISSDCIVDHGKCQILHCPGILRWFRGNS